MTGPARLALAALVLLPLAACGKKAPLRPPSDDRRPAAERPQDEDAPPREGEAEGEAETDPAADGGERR